MQRYGMLGGDIGDLTTVIGQVHARFASIFNPAMATAHQIGVAEHIDVAPHGLRGNVKMFGQLVNRDKAVTAQDVDDVALSRRNIHLIVQFVVLNIEAIIRGFVVTKISEA